MRTAHARHTMTNFETSVPEESAGARPVCGVLPWLAYDICSVERKRAES